MNILKRIVSKIFNSCVFAVRSVNYGSNLTINGRIFVRGRGRIIIGDNVTINSNRESNPIGGDTRTVLFVKENAQLIIGNGCGISNSAIVVKDKVTIEDNVFIGGNCKIYDHDFHSLDYVERISKNDNGGKSVPVIIKKGAFVGGHSIILKGVKIGEMCIIGAGSVVTKNVPDGEIWAGNPARFIGKIHGQSTT